jgi:Flp pilus assembly protein TadG
MMLVSVIVLVAVLAGPAGAQSVYQNGDPAYPVLEINSQTETPPAITWADHAADWVAKLAATSTGTAVKVAVGLYNAVVSKSVPVTQATINF